MPSGGVHPITQSGGTSRPSGNRRAIPSGPSFAQPRLLPAHPGTAGGDRTVLNDHAAGPAGEDRRQDRPPGPVDHIPDGRGDGTARHVPENACRYRRPAPVAFGAMMTTTARSRSAWVSAGDARPDADSLGEIPPQTAIEPPSARQPASAWQCHHCRKPRRALRALPEGRLGRSYGECRFRPSQPPLVGRRV